MNPNSAIEQLNDTLKWVKKQIKIELLDASEEGSVVFYVLSLQDESLIGDLI